MRVAWSFFGTFRSFASLAAWLQEKHEIRSFASLAASRFLRLSFKSHGLRGHTLHQITLSFATQRASISRQFKKLSKTQKPRNTTPGTIKTKTQNHDLKEDQITGFRGHTLHQITLSCCSGFTVLVD